MKTYIAFFIAIVLLVLFFVIGFIDKQINYYDPVLDGHSHSKLRSVAYIYKENLLKNYDLGSSFVVDKHDETVMQMYGGYADLQYKMAWNAETMTRVFDLSNLAVIFSVAHLVDKGLLAYESPLKEYFPLWEASMHNVTVAELLTHRAGVPHLNDPINMYQYRSDPKAFVQSLRKQRRLYPDATHPILHKHTLALYANYLIERVDKKRRNLAKYFYEEIVLPNSLDMKIGVSRNEQFRVARCYSASWRASLTALLWLDSAAWRRLLFGGNALSRRVHSSSALFDTASSSSSFRGNPEAQCVQHAANQPEWLEAHLPSHSLFANAASLVKLMRLLLPRRAGSSAENKASGWIRDSTRLQMLRRFQSPNAAALAAGDDVSFDPVLGRDVIYTQGGLMIKDAALQPHVFGYASNSGGQVVWLDLKNRITLAYVTNHLRAWSPPRDHVINELVETTLEILREPHPIA